MKKTFSRYEVFLITILVFLQFTVILDFMILSPLGAILLQELKISTSQFGIVVSAYAWSAGISGLLAAGFADKFDRKKILLFFYTGFLIGTFLCGIATDYTFLLLARIVTGIFGGVIGSVSYTIVTDLFPLQVRGRVMGFLQMAFAGAAVLGLPIGLYLANKWGWQSAFIMIVAVCVVLLLLILLYVKPVNAHLAAKPAQHPVRHLIKTVSNKTYAKAFCSTLLLATAGFMLMPFGSAFAVNNNGISVNDLPLLYTITGISAMLAAPLIGKLSDKAGKYIVFVIFSCVMIAAVTIHSNLDIIPFYTVIIFSVLMFVSYSGRMIASSALVTAVPALPDRGAFMSINSSVNMISGGIASLVAGSIVYQLPSGRVENYDILGYVVAGATTITIVIMYFINKMVSEKQHSYNTSKNAD
jgi:predicted MFS family arabinose efflux permease